VTAEERSELCSIDLPILAMSCEETKLLAALNKQSVSS
jgi:hypothetical protein